MLIHPAHSLSFDELSDRLKQAREDRLVYERTGPDGLSLYVYSEHCVYDRKWDTVTLAARGLILDRENRRIAATPFPKFFNVGENAEPIPSLPFRAFDKLDGSLIIVFFHRGAWKAVTKGSFYSSQSAWAQARLDRMDLSPLNKDNTYLIEVTYPENRIVVRHTEEAMHLLAAYGPDGREMSWPNVVATAEAIGLQAARTYQFDTISELVLFAKGLPRSAEGFVVRFENGLRLKIKGDEYKRIHALISGLTPLAMWEAMSSKMDMQDIRRDLPEEFWGDFDQITGLLESSASRIVTKLRDAAEELATLSDKEVGLRLPTLDSEVRPLIFEYRKSGGRMLTGRMREKLFRMIRPTGNELPGYMPSHAIKRVEDETG